MAATNVNPTTENENNSRAYDALAGDDTQFVENAITRLPAWAKSSAAVQPLGQFNLSNNKAFQVLTKKLNLKS